MREQGYEKYKFLPFLHFISKFSGKPFGNNVHIPSVSNSKGFPNKSINFLLS